MSTGASPRWGLPRFARASVAHLLQRFAAEVKRASAHLDVEAVHDLRVSIRRLNQGLRVFEESLPARPARRVRKQTTALRRLAGEVRDLDISIAEAARRRWNAPLRAGLTAARAAAAVRLQSEVARIAKREPWNKWSSKLGLE
jgi:CHAD domain-containing protein